MLETGTISKEDASLFLMTDSISEAIQFIKQKSIEAYGLLPRQKHKPFKWLLENNLVANRKKDNL